ncbi:hypothetical protein BS78_05G202400 [Paspalum vaginatum]|nr:hypothetical protein BS78_05G202400 [Paspalum vaginatum]
MEVALSSSDCPPRQRSAGAGPLRGQPTPSAPSLSAPSPRGSGPVEAKRLSAGQIWRRPPPLCPPAHGFDEAAAPMDESGVAVAHPRRLPPSLFLHATRSSTRLGSAPRASVIGCPRWRLFYEYKENYPKLQERERRELQAKGYVEVDDEWVQSRAEDQALIDETWKRIDELFLQYPQTDDEDEDDDDSDSDYSDEDY